MNLGAAVVVGINVVSMAPAAIELVETDFFVASTLHLESRSFSGEGTETLTVTKHERSPRNEVVSVFEEEVSLLDELPSAVSAQSDVQTSVVVSNMGDTWEVAGRILSESFTFGSATTDSMATAYVKFYCSEPTEALIKVDPFWFATASGGFGGVAVSLTVEGQFHTFDFESQGARASLDYFRRRVVIPPGECELSVSVSDQKGMADGTMFGSLEVNFGLLLQSRASNLAPWRLVRNAEGLRVKNFNLARQYIVEWADRPDAESWNYAAALELFADAVWRPESLLKSTCPQPLYFRVRERRPGES
ncbi:MAG: hypothetical protein ACFB21_07970 [Opitutales bacterium]